MKLSIINGSPRGNSSNSKKITAWVERNLIDTEVTNSFLLNIQKHDEVIEDIKESNSYLFCFPLYVDSMPGQVKHFFELMENNKDHFIGKSISFIIHSGFPERVQSENLKKYLKLFAIEIMDMKHLGVIIIPGSEALQMAPDKMFSKQIKVIESIIPLLEKELPLPLDINYQISNRERLSLFSRILFRLNPFKNFYWNYRASRHDYKVDLMAKPY